MDCCCCRNISGSAQYRRSTPHCVGMCRGCYGQTGRLKNRLLWFRYTASDETVQWHAMRCDVMIWNGMECEETGCLVANMLCPSMSMSYSYSFSLSGDERRSGLSSGPSKVGGEWGWFVSLCLFCLCAGIVCLGLIAQIGRARVCALRACNFLTGGNAVISHFGISQFTSLTFAADFVVFGNANRI